MLPLAGVDPREFIGTLSFQAASTPGHRGEGAPAWLRGRSRRAVVGAAHPAGGCGAEVGYGKFLSETQVDWPWSVDAEVSMGKLIQRTSA